MCVLQSGRLNELPVAKEIFEIRAQRDGYLSTFDVEKIGLAGILLRAGRLKNDDLIIPTAGIEFHLKINDAVKKGDLIYTLHGDQPELFEKAAEMLSASYEISLQKPLGHVLIKTVMS